jgi:hypothetical protein
VGTVRDEFSEPKRSQSFISGGGLTISYLAPFHLLVETGAHLQAETALFLNDSGFGFSEFSIQAGLDIPLGHDWHLLPKFGRVRVNLEPTAQSLGVNGIAIKRRIASSDRTSDVYELSLRKHFEDYFALGVSYRELQLPDGPARTLSIELVLRF